MARRPVAQVLAEAVLPRLPADLRRRLLLARWAQLRIVRRAGEALGRGGRSAPAAGGLDRQLLALLGPGGVFVEAGANDGYQQSNTYLLERLHGWRGLLVEPIPALAAQARLNRPDAVVLEAALVAADEERTSVRMVYGGLMSVVAGARGGEDADRDWAATVTSAGLESAYEVTVPARTLSSLVDEADIGPIDLLSLDIEGFEPQALDGLDMDRHAPRWALVEIRDAERLEQVTERLASRYVLDRWLSDDDALFRRRDIVA